MVGWKDDFHPYSHDKFTLQNKLTLKITGRYTEMKERVRAILIL